MTCSESPGTGIPQGIFEARREMLKSSIPLNKSFDLIENENPHHESVPDGI